MTGYHSPDAGGVGAVGINIPISRKQEVPVLVFEEKEVI